MIRPVLAALALAASPALAAPETARQADALATAVGVNTHVCFTGTVYDVHYADIVKPRLLELGTKHVREDCGSAINNQPKLADLGAAGITTLAVMPATLPASLPSWVEAIEPPNETDNTWGASWASQMRTWMQANHAAMEALRPGKVLGPSFADTRDSPGALAAVFPAASAYMDHGNLHDYSGVYPEGPLGGGWGISVDQALADYAALSGRKNKWVTENGYIMSGSAPGFPAVTQRAAAKYLPRQILWHITRSVPRYYVYDLLNEGPANYGLLNNDGSPRLQFTSLKNLVALFADPGASFAPGSLDFLLSGTMTNIQHVLFQKRDGRFYLVLWQGVSSSTGTTDATIGDIEPPPRAVGVALAAVAAKVTVYQPSFGTAPVATFTNAVAFQVQVPDHIAVLELAP